MRAVIFFVLCGACGGAVQPAMLPNLATLPEDGQTRDAVIDGSFAQPGPEQQPVTKRGRKIETSAATAAALLGMFFSKTENTTIGVRFEEGDVVGPKQPHRPEGAAGSAADATSPPPTAPASDLVPWIRVAPSRDN